MTTKVTADLLGTIPNSSLANSTVSGVSLGSNLGTLSLGVSGTGLSGSATYNGSTGNTFTVTSNATNNNTAGTIVARDSSGNFSAGTITAALNGTASNATYATTQTTGTNDNTIATTAFVQNSLPPSAVTAKAWVYWIYNGTNYVIQAAYNVSSITDFGGGNIGINFTTPFSDALYAWAGGVNAVNYAGGGTMVESSRNASTLSLFMAHYTSGVGPMLTNGSIVVFR